MMAMSAVSVIVTAGSFVKSSTTKFSGTSSSKSVKRLIEKHWISPCGLPGGKKSSPEAEVLKSTPSEKKANYRLTDMLNENLHIGITSSIFRL